MKTLLSAIILSLLLSSAYAQETHTVKRVIDGDTLELENGERVRLIGIDCPESKPNDKAKRDAERTEQDIETITQMGKEAKEFVTGLVEGKEVRLELDVQKKDKYGRLLVYVFLLYDMTNEFIEYIPIEGVTNIVSRDGRKYHETFVNAHIIQQGYASPMTIPPNVKYVESFKKLYQEARENKSGLWSEQEEKRRAKK